MRHLPDHIPAAAAADHAALIVALDAGDLAGSERDRAATLVGACAGCASLRADLAVIRVAVAALPAPRRARDYRLTDADAARLRPSAWGRLLGWLGAPRSSVRPLAGSLAALGIVGLLLGTAPALLGGAATTLPMAAQAPLTAPAPAGASNGAGAGDVRQGAVPATSTGPVAAGVPATTSAPAATPGVAALPAPSAVAGAVPAPSPVLGTIPEASTIPTEGAQTGPAAFATPGSPGSSPGAGTMDSAAKAGGPDAAQGAGNAAPTPPSPTSTPDRAPLLALSMALLAVGIGLFVANRVLRRRAAA